MRNKLRVVHIINSFECGGAEAMLCNLLMRTDRAHFEPMVVSLIDNLSIAGPVIQAGIPVEVIGLKPGVPDPRALLRLGRYLRRTRPDVIHTWMDHANLIGGVAALAAPARRVVWGIHHSSHIPGVAKRSTIMAVRLAARLSRRLTSAIVFCSEKSRELYVEQGFDSRRMMVIPNGFNTTRYSPDPDARASVRRDLQLPPDAKLVGMAARYNPQKDFPNFLRAAATLLAGGVEAYFVLCGSGVDSKNAALVNEIESMGLTRRVRLFGQRPDMQRIYAALDVGVLSSVSGEAFPLVLGEAMACGTPCASTDVGDSALIVGSTGRIVPPKNSAALAGAIAQLLALRPDERSLLGEAARRRVCENFDLGAITRRYEALYSNLVQEEGGPCAPAEDTVVGNSSLPAHCDAA